MSLSQPEFAADGKTIGALVYFSSASENTARFVAGCRLQDEGINVYRIPLRAADPDLLGEVQLAGAVLDFTRGNETFLTSN